MPHRFEGQRTLMRIFLSETDRCRDGPHKGRLLYEALVHVLREEDSPAPRSFEA